MAQSDFSFSHSLRVRWAEVDMQAVVFNGHYLTYFDVALTEYWRTVGLPSPILQAQLGTELFVRKASLEYHASAKFDDILDIGVRCSKIGHTSITFIIEINSNEQYLVSGEMIYVFFDRQQQKSTPIPLDWIEMLDLFELSTPIVKKS
jgi:acyl-CoA thioester hydrolase